MIGAQPRSNPPGKAFLICAVTALALSGCVSMPVEEATQAIQRYTNELSRFVSLEVPRKELADRRVRAGWITENLDAFEETAAVAFCWSWDDPHYDPTAICDTDDSYGFALWNPRRLKGRRVGQRIIWRKPGQYVRFDEHGTPSLFFYRFGLLGVIAEWTPPSDQLYIEQVSLQLDDTVISGYSVQKRRGNYDLLMYLETNESP